MPVGTQGTVRALSPNDLRAAGATMVLANTYHLHVRPGEHVVEQLGRLHRFMGWDRPLLTDSGGFQVFSLEGFDHVVPGGADEPTARDALERTLRWLERCARRHRELLEGWKVGTSSSVHPSNLPTFPQTLWPILQGGTHLELRSAGLRRILDLGSWTGLAIGGLSVGEPKPT